MITLATLSILFAACISLAVIKFIIALTYRPMFSFEDLQNAANACAAEFRKFAMSANEMRAAINRFSDAFNDAKINPENQSRGSVNVR